MYVVPERSLARIRIRAGLNHSNAHSFKRLRSTIGNSPPTSLKTTNALKSIHARVESRTAKVGHWKSSEQNQQWLATALLDLEPRLRRLRNYRALPLLREALRRQLETKKSAA